MKNISPVLSGIIAWPVVTMIGRSLFFLPRSLPTTSSMPFQANIAKLTAENTNFRQVLFTGKNSQLVVMSIPPGGEVGQETHKFTEQVLYFQSGTGEAILHGKTTQVSPGDVVIVTPGTQHNFRNTGKVPLQITTTYAPPNHIDGRMHKTKADADADLEDEAVGETHP